MKSISFLTDTAAAAFVNVAEFVTHLGKALQNLPVTSIFCFINNILYGILLFMDFPLKVYFIIGKVMLLVVFEILITRC